MGRWFKSVALASEEPTQFVAVDQKPDHQIGHAFGFAEADCTAYQALDSRPQIDVLAVDPLHIFLANGVLIGLQMMFVSAPAIGVIACDTKGLEQCFEL